MHRVLPSALAQPPLLLSALLLSALLSSAPPALAAGGPQGRYGLDVDATLANMTAAGKGSPKLRGMLEETKALMVFDFAGDAVTFTSGSRVTGRCRFTLAASAVTLAGCTGADGQSSFRFSGTMTYDQDSNTISVVGPSSPAPVVYAPR